MTPLQALAELVALEDERLRLRALHEMGHGTDYDHYHKALPLAWAAARAALAVPGQSVQDAIRRTAERCREMALWPQSIDDEQAYYGRMFAEFIEREFDLKDPT